MTTKQPNPRFLNIRIDTQTDWVSAACPELKVSGYGPTINGAVVACVRSMESKLGLKIKRQEFDLEGIENGK